MRGRSALLLLSPLAVACATGPEGPTLAELHDVEPDMREVQVEDSLDQAMLGYRAFLEETPESALTPEAMRRLADLKLEKQYGILGDSEIQELPAPESAEGAEPDRTQRPEAGRIADHSESAEDFERRATRADAIQGTDAEADLPGGRQLDDSGPLEAIALYDQILAEYPTYPYNDQVLYQKARAYDELGRTDEAIAVIERLIAEYPGSRHIDEVQFRRAEYFFVRRKYLDAEEAYLAITEMGPASDYYELALYKLGWTFYKQELHREALDRYIELLDYKVSTGYDFDQSRDEDDERRIADTFRVISLSFSNLGGPDSVQDYFAANGQRSYEDRIYSHLGEFYLEKLRYHDAAAAYKAFVRLHPLHRSAPHFNMRVVEIYEKGGFPKLVLESKKEFAASYGLQSEYWRHHDVGAMPEVLSYLKANLGDLASHYHALYQTPELSEEKAENFQESLRWYRAYLASFPQEPETPGVNHRLADLLLEHGDFGDAAREYERTAYDYGEHEQAAAAGYAAIYAHRKHQKAAVGAERKDVRRQAVTSSLRFVDTFPDHEHAASVMGAAVDDLYEMKEFERAIATGRRLLAEYPDAEQSIRRSAWAAIAHSSFDTADYSQAEDGYTRVLEMTAEGDESRQGFIDNLAAAIYKQGERAAAAEDDRAAADHFLRVASAAPGSSIRPAAEYDAAAALIRLEDWAGAGAVLEAFREAHPDHELNQEATKQLAFVRRQQGDLARAAQEYEQVAAETEDEELRREALLLAGELYEDAGAMEQAVSSYLRYVSDFPSPLETAVETRFKVAELHQAMGDEAAYRDQLRRIVEIDGSAGAERTPRVRYLAARSALVLAEDSYHRFVEVRLVQPFDQNLQKKQARMDAALDAFGGLLDYEVGEVTAAATFYMAELYRDFSQALTGSERPSGLSPADLQDYEMALEEEAFPFEERAIEVHEKNLELMSAGVYNAWIEKSLAQLAELMPGRYAKFETSSGPIASIDTYAYQPVGAAAVVREDAAPEPAPESETAPLPAAPDSVTEQPVPEETAPLPAAADPGAGEDDVPPVPAAEEVSDADQG